MQVRVTNPQYNRPGVWMFDQPEYFDYEGEEVKLKWTTPNQLALSTDNPEFPVRIIPRDRIVAIDNVVHVPQMSAATTKVVKGSKGEDYVVTLGPKPTCTCTGFQFRKTCKHVNS